MLSFLYLYFDSLIYIFTAQRIRPTGCKGLGIWQKNNFVLISNQYFLIFLRFVIKIFIYSLSEIKDNFQVFFSFTFYWDTLQDLESRI